MILIRESVFTRKELLNGKKRNLCGESCEVAMSDWLSFVEVGVDSKMYMACFTVDYEES